MVLTIFPVTALAEEDDTTELQNMLNNGGTVRLNRDYIIGSTLEVDRTVTL